MPPARVRVARRTEFKDMRPGKRNIPGRGNVIELVDVDASAFGAYLAGGVVTSVKEAFTVAMQPIEMASLDAALVTEDVSSVATTVPVGCLHACFQALDEFQVHSLSLRGGGWGWGEGWSGDEVLERGRALNSRFPYSLPHPSF